MPFDARRARDAAAENNPGVADRQLKAQNRKGCAETEAHTQRNLLKNPYRADPQTVLVVPSAGLEPARPFGQRILSPLRLPIPPRGLKAAKF
jgi:hypothetical protein